MNCPRCGTELVNAGSIKTGEYHEAVVTRGMGFGEPGPLHTPDRCADVLAARCKALEAERGENKRNLTEAFRLLREQDVNVDALTRRVEVDRELNEQLSQVKRERDGLATEARQYQVRLLRMVDSNAVLTRQVAELEAHIIDRDRLIDFDARGVVELTDRTEFWKSRYESCKALLLKFREYGWMGKAGRAEVDAVLAASQATRKDGET